MNRKPAASVELFETRADPVAPPTGHLVVKRGHRGRYRMALVSEGMHMKGDLTVDGVKKATRAADAHALALFARAATALIALIATARVKP